jgi:hypothetical protein
MTPREQRLALGFVILLLGGGAWIGYEQLMRWKARLDAKAVEIEVMKSESAELLAQQGVWDQRSGWLAEKQTAYKNRADADNSLLGIVTETAGRHGVTIKRNQPADPIERPGMVASTMIVEAGGEMEKVMRWLHDLQQPAAFISVPALRLIPNAEDTAKVDISVSVHRWFKKPSS